MTPAAVSVTVRLTACVFVSPPPVAVTATLAVFVGAVEVAVSVKVVEPPPGVAMLVGAKPAVTPIGSPLIDKATADLNPFANVVVRVMWVEPPRATLALKALGVRVKAGVGTVRLTACVLVIPPAAADTVKVETPGATVEPANRVMVPCPLPGAAMLEGAKVAVTPDGSPITESAMAQLNPVPAVVVRVMGIDPPRATLRLEALSDSVKLARTVRLRI